MDLNKKSMNGQDIPKCILEFEEKSFELENLLINKKELPKNFLEMYPVFISKENEDLYLKFPSYSLKLPYVDDYEIETIKTFIKSYQIRENVLIEYYYEENKFDKNMFILSINIKEKPLEKNLIVTQKIEELLNEKKIYFNRVISHSLRVFPKHLWKRG